MNEFASLTSELQILFLFTILESNRRSTSNSPSATPSSPRIALPSSPIVLPSNDDSDGSETTAANANKSNHDSKIIPSDVLDTFFPFDPFHLPKSKRFIEGIYIEWKGSNDGDEESDNGDDFMGERKEI